MKRLIIITISLFVLSSSLCAQTELYKAAYTLNFLNFIGFPPVNGSSFIIGVYQDDKVYNHLLPANNIKSVGPKKVKVIKIDNLDNARSCQVLYIGNIISNEQAEKLRVSMIGYPTVFITSATGKIPIYSMINFKSVSGKLKFHLNEEEFQRLKLKIDGKLISLSGK